MALTRNMKTAASRERWKRIEEAARNTPEWVKPNIAHLVEVLRQEKQAEKSVEGKKPSRES